MHAYPAVRGDRAGCLPVAGVCDPPMANPYRRSSMQYQDQNMPPLELIRYTAMSACSRYNRLGPIFHTNLFMQPMVFVGEPSLVKAVMGMDSMELRVPVFASERLLGDISLAKDSVRNKIFVSSLTSAAVCAFYCSAGLCLSLHRFATPKGKHTVNTWYKSCQQHSVLPVHAMPLSMVIHLSHQTVTCPTSPVFPRRTPCAVAPYTTSCRSCSCHAVLRSSSAQRPHTCRRGSHQWLLQHTRLSTHTLLLLPRSASTRCPRSTAQRTRATSRRWWPWHHSTWSAGRSRARWTLLKR